MQGKEVLRQKSRRRVETYTWRSKASISKSWNVRAYIKHVNQLLGSVGDICSLVTAQPSCTLPTRKRLEVGNGAE